MVEHTEKPRGAEAVTILISLEVSPCETTMLTISRCPATGKEAMVVHRRPRRERELPD